MERGVFSRSMRYDDVDCREHTIQIEIPQSGFDAYSFTFG